MKHLLLYVGLGLSAFAAFAIIFAPASAVWLLIGDRVEATLPQLRVFSVDGTVWSGSSDFQYQEFPVSYLEWNLDPLSVFGGSADMDLNLTGEGLRIQAHGSISARQMEIQQFSGFVDSDYINAASQQYGLTFSGRLDIVRLLVTFDHRWVTEASGKFNWDGGRVIFQSAAQVQVLDLPPLSGKLYSGDPQLHLDVQHEQEPVLEVILKPTGWAAVNLKGRLFEIGGITWPGGPDPDATALRVEERIFPGLSEDSS
ncbi:MAG: type II secretion system protein N [Pseudomonadales bacterium]